MQRKNTVLLAEDFENQYLELEFYLNKCKINIVKCTNNKSDIMLELVKEAPAAVIFNYAYHSLEDIGQIINFGNNMKLSADYFNIYCYDAGNYLAKLLKLGVKANLQTPYDFEGLVKYIYNNCLHPETTDCEFKENVVSRINDILSEMGVTTVYLGKSYICEILKENLFKFGEILNLKNAYIKCANKYGVSAESVRKAVETAVKTGWTKSSAELKKTVFPENYETGKRPTNRQFIAALAKYIRLEFSYHFEVIL